MMAVMMNAGQTTAILADRLRATLAIHAIPVTHAGHKDRRDLSRGDNFPGLNVKKQGFQFPEGLACFFVIVRASYHKFRSS